MDHKLSVRVPSLVAGKNYIMRAWTRNPLFAEVKFLGYVQDGVVRDKLLPINKMTDVDVLHFESNGVVIFGIQRDQCLVLRESGVRITFFSADEH